MTDKELNVLWVGLSNSRVAWYRCVLPAMYLGQDWMGVVGEPPKLQHVTGYVKNATQLARFEDYQVIIVQQARGRGWFKLIHELRAKGIVVLYEIDDYVHGIRKARDHDFAEYFQKDDLERMEMCMRACDGIIASTEYIARRYRKFNKRVWVCENGLDMGRYRLTLPPRGELVGVETVTLGWSGATGHFLGVEPWLEAVRNIMREHEHVCFATIGQDFAGMFREEFGARVVAIPFAALETYPAAMCLFDIALAPAGRTGFYAGKSELRAMEAAALGIPIVADTHYAGAVLNGHTGFVAENVEEAEGQIETLVLDKELRVSMGAAGRQHAIETFDMRIRKDGWRDAILDAVGATQ